MSGSTSLAVYLRRSIQKLHENTTAMIRMRGMDNPSMGPRPLFSLRSKEEINEFVAGSDKDMGGASTAMLGPDSAGRGGAVFSGSLRATVMTSKNALGGYAAFRSRNRPTMFGPILSDVTFHEFLALRCRVAGAPQTRNSYFVNIQTDEVAQSTEIWQHRLYFARNDGLWEDIFIPFSSFICTNGGNIVENEEGPRSTLSLPRDKIRTIGISLLGTTETDGEFELGLEDIRAVNKEEIQQQEDGLANSLALPALGRDSMPMPTHGER